MELKNKKISFIGDSITFGLGASEKQNRYTDVLAENTGLREIKNHGINGTRIARQQNVNPEWESDTNAFVERFSDIEEDTDIIVIFGGTNDHGHGDVPFGEDDDFTMDTFCGALNYLFQGLMKKYPGAELVVLTPLHKEDEYIKNKVTGLELKDYVNKIKERAEFYSIPVLDLFSCIGIQPRIEENKKRFTADGLHPNDEGYRRIAEKLEMFLKLL